MHYATTLLAVVCALACGGAHGATFSASLKGMRMRKFERGTSHLSPTLKRIASMAQRRVLDSMIMLFDDSGSITAAHFETAKVFARDVIDSETTPWGTLNLQLGVAKFGVSASQVLALTTSASSATAGVNNMPYGRAGATNIEHGLRLAGSMMAHSRGQKLILLWTDGRHNTGGSPVQRADALKAQGVCIIVVAIGPSVDDQMLSNIEGCGPVVKSLPPPRKCRGRVCPQSKVTAKPSSTCQPGGMLIKTDFNEIEQNVSAFMSKVQGVFEAGSQCA